MAKRLLKLLLLLQLLLLLLLLLLQLLMLLPLLLLLQLLTLLLQLLLRSNFRCLGCTKKARHESAGLFAFGSPVFKFSMPD